MDSKNNFISYLLVRNFIGSAETAFDSPRGFRQQQDLRMAVMKPIGEIAC
ncbi:MAG: hypothetical protein GDA48_02975 [Hormoscilla sp. GM102CHS1]|nr:hypothetical protein [Hormoscilla sp. GM102CHS1]